MPSSGKTGRSSPPDLILRARYRIMAPEGFGFNENMRSDSMKRLHLMMLVVVLVFAGIFVGRLSGGSVGAHAGAAAGAVLAGILLWVIAPMEYQRQLRIIERRGAKLTNPEAFRDRFIKGARTPAAILVILGLAALVVILLVRY